ncbi:MAG: HPr family phosphocarrier protein [Lachnospiraceae bacterium]|nr:HPr family phosphocarrier protein [Lachnospiraceae bacterium]
MTSVTININSIEKVKKFVNVITVYDNDFDLVCDRYVIDAKSIMGIFSLDLSQNLKLNIQKDTDVDAILADIDEFIVK